MLEAPDQGSKETFPQAESYEEIQERKENKVRHEITVQGLLDLAWNLERHKDTWTNLEAKRLAGNAEQALRELFAWEVSHGAPTTSVLLATEKFVQ